jgi:Tfp pilus assembly protein PilE
VDEHRPHSPAKAPRKKGTKLLEAAVVAMTVLVIASVAIPAFLAERAERRDSVAKSLLEEAASELEACAEETGSFGDCYTARMNRRAPEIDWVVNTAASAARDEVAVSELEDSEYTLRTTSETGYTFFYSYDDGNVARTVNRPVGGIADW